MTNDELPPPNMTELVHEYRHSAEYMAIARAYAQASPELAYAVAVAEGWTPENIARATELREMERLGDM